MQIVEDYLVQIKFTSFSEQDFTKFETQTLLEFETLYEKVITDLHMSKVEQSYSTNIKNIERFLSSHGINVSELSSRSKSLASEMISGFKSGSNPRDLAIKLSTKAKGFILKSLRKVKDIVADEENQHSIILSLVGSVILFCVHTTLRHYGMGIGAIALLIAPFTEEYMKRLAVKIKIPYLYTGIFAGIEFVIMISQMMTAGFTVPFAILTRISSVMLHFLTTYIQQKGYEKGEKDITSTNSKIGFGLAIATHFFFNLMGLFYNQEILSGLSKIIAPF